MSWNFLMATAERSWRHLTKSWQHIKRLPNYLKYSQSLANLELIATYESTLRCGVQVRPMIAQHSHRRYMTHMACDMRGRLSISRGLCCVEFSRGHPFFLIVRSQTSKVRSRLYRRRSQRSNIRWKTLDEIHKFHILLVTWIFKSSLIFKNVLSKM